MVINARVTTKGATFLMETKYPVPTPDNMQTNIVSSTARGKGKNCKKYPDSTQPRATTDPTERSIPPVNMTSSIPILTMAIPEFCLSRLEMFLKVRKEFEMMLETIMSSTKMTIVLYLTSSMRGPFNLILEFIYGLH
jgi:hypothetical protein